MILLLLLKILLLLLLGTFPKDFPQAATSQVCPSPPLKPVLSAALAPLAYPSRSAQPRLQPAAPQKAYHNLWEFAAWGIAHLGSCHFGSRPWEDAFEKVPNTNNTTTTNTTTTTTTNNNNNNNNNGPYNSISDPHWDRG